MVGVKNNFIFSAVLTVSNYFFTFMTYPYVSRVLGVTNIGICNFVDSIINYFILFTMLGVSSIGIREVSASKNDKEALSKTFSSLVFINAFTTLIGCFILIVCIFTIPKLWEHRVLMSLGFVKLLVNFICIEWFFKGLENFKYITTRSIAIRFFYVIGVFIFVREPSDYIIYYFFVVVTVVANGVINLLYGKKFVEFSFAKIDVKRYIKPIGTMGSYVILTSMYTSFNIVFLGFVAGETQVGYYSTATKFYTILLSLFTSFTSVMLPRMASILSSNNQEEFFDKIKKSLELLYLFVFPVFIIVEVNSGSFIYLLSGTGYEGAILPMRIIMPLMFIIGYEQILVLQILIPLKKDKEVLKGSILGASIGILSNILLVKIYGAVGTSMVWIISEIGVACVAQYYVSKFTNLKFPFKGLFKRALFYCPIFYVCILLKNIDFNFLASIFSQSIVVFIYTLTIEYNLLSNKLLIQNIERFKQNKKNA